MAQGIEVPQSIPNAPQFQVPTDLVNAYLSRKQQDQQFMVNQMSELGGALNSYQQQKLQNQMGALGARVQATRLLGPGMANQIYAGQNPTVSGSQPAPSQDTAALPANQDQAPSPYIAASIAAGHPAHPDIAAFHAPDYQGQLQNVQGQMQQLGNQGEYGREQSGQLAQQVPLITAQMNNERETAQFKQSRADEEDRFRRTQDTKIGQASAELQSKYQLPETKIQAAAAKLQNLWDSYKSIPDSQKGAYVGLVTSKAGSPAGQRAPELVTYNKLREAAAVSLAIARNPENPRPSPQDIQDELKNLPSAGDASTVANNLFDSSFLDLKDMHNISTQGAQAAAKHFGGSVVPGPTPQFNRGAQATQVPQNASPSMPTISNAASFKALPSGSWFKDPTGQTHRKK